MNKLTRNDKSILLGNFLDHFDSALYGFLAPILAPIFFPKFDPVVQMILAYSLFATSLITRPIGCLIFGNLANKYGPSYSLYFSIIGVAFSTSFVGFLPSYESVGWPTTLALVALRSIKGTFASGESCIARLYILENKPHNTAFRASYMYQSCVMLGIIAASGACTLVMYFKEYPDIWRGCFFLSGALGLIAIYGRNMFCNVYNRKFYSLPHLSLQSFSSNKLNLCKVAITTGLSHVTYSIPFVVMNTLIPYVTDIDFSDMMLLNTALLVVDLFLILIIGPIISKFDCVKIMLISSLALGIVTPLLFFRIPGAELWYVTFVRIWIVFWGIVFMCPMNLYYKNLFQDNPEQYMLVGLASSAGAATIGKMTPALCFWLWYESHNIWLIGIYIGAVSLIAFALILRKYNESI